MKKILLAISLIIYVFASAQIYTLSKIAGTGSSTFAGDGEAATNAEINSPYQITTDDSGNVYFSDFGNNRIRKISTSGIISTIAGNGANGYSGNGAQATAAALSNPVSVALDKSGNMYIADAGNYVIRLINTSGRISNFAGTNIEGYSGNGGQATAANLFSPYGVSIDDTGNVYIVDQGANCVRKVNTAGIITTIIATGTSVTGYGGDGGLATAAKLNDPRSIVFDSLGNMYLSEFSGERIRKVNTNNIISTFAGNGVAGYAGDGHHSDSAVFYNPAGVAIDELQNIYVIDNFNNRIRAINTNSIISTVIGNGTNTAVTNGVLATNTSIAGPMGFAINNKTGNMYIADAAHNLIRKVNTNDTISTIAGGGIGDGGAQLMAALNTCQGVGTDNAGNIYIADSKNNRIRKINSNGIITTIAGNGVKGYNGDGGYATAAELNYPVSIAIDNTGNVFFVDNGNGRVRKISTNGIISLIGGNGSILGGGTSSGVAATSAEINGPTGICLDDTGNVYVACPNGEGIIKINTSGIMTQVYQGSTTSSPYGVTIDNNNNLYFADYAANNITEINN